MCRQLRETKTSIIELIGRKSDEELYGSPWYGKWTMGRMISFNTSSPYANARKRTRGLAAHVVNRAVEWWIVYTRLAGISLSR